MRDELIQNWKLYGYYPYVPKLGKSVETGGWFLPVVPEVPAVVPGNVYVDLMRSGIIPDPRVELNSFSCEWVCQRWWLYRAVFLTPEEPGKYDLRFGGIDFASEIYLNGEKIGGTRNMFVSHSFDVTDLLKPPGQENRLEIVLCGAPDEMGQIGFTSRAVSLKSRFTYKWDFSARLIHLGITGPVELRNRSCVRIEELRLRTLNAAAGQAVLCAELSCDHEETGRIRFALSEGEREVFAWEQDFSVSSGRSQAECSVEIPAAKLWYPNGTGTPFLYGLTAVWTGAERVEKTVCTGIREFRMLPNESAPADALPYTMCVNGKKIYIKGVNYVPLDVMYGGLETARYEQFFNSVAGANVNLVRIWGGGILESERFFEIADRLGIVIWQEFPQSSSGIENVPCEQPEFLAELKRIAEFEIRTLRRHPSVCIFCGGNELTDAEGNPCGIGNANLSMLEECVRRLAPETIFIPTSASGPCENRSDDPLKNHDVHGPWQYAGTEEHYRFYNETSCLLHSEFGVEGMASMESLRTFLSEENLGVFDNSNFSWRHHGEWWISTRRDESVFGKIHSLDDLILASQFLQAEGLRYALEANRRSPVNSGSIVWQADESFPNVSCTSLIDYYGRPKRALEQVKKAFSPLNLSLRYHKLQYLPGEEIPLSAFVVWDGRENTAECRIEISAGGETRVFEKKVFCGGGRAERVFAPEDFGEIKAPDLGAIRIKLFCRNKDAVYENEVVLLTADESGRTQLETIK